MMSTPIQSAHQACQVEAATGAAPAADTPAGPA
eukprot:CAMPEP_0172924524 /NCGR_PEP_ID=MMETSP1075-20121228/211894_1 /TAXON_ID=2916 /ORGANISM="Ceratium fusus, Strain PA161109" /LENGTH=32 /DNA_ID= /DNA_START= /DNA_END= /DNA_ORIENTATION=